MPGRDQKVFNAYLDALAERNGAVAALEFLPDEMRSECETRIHELNVKLANEAAALGQAQLELYKATSDAKRHNIADLIAHLERMLPPTATMTSGGTWILWARLRELPRTLTLSLSGQSVWGVPTPE